MAHLCSGNPNHDRDVRNPGYHQNGAHVGIFDALFAKILTRSCRRVQSHIHELGIDDRLEPRANLQEMVVQAKAREAVGVILKTVQEGRIAGRVMSFTGPPSMGKTVLCWVRLCYFLLLTLP